MADVARHMILPGVTLALYFMASYARLTRTAMIEVADQDFVKTARAKGISERQVARRHILRNALIPLVTYAGLQASHPGGRQRAGGECLFLAGHGHAGLSGGRGARQSAAAGHLHRHRRAGQPVQSASPTSPIPSSIRGWSWDDELCAPASSPGPPPSFGFAVFVVIVVIALAAPLIFSRTGPSPLSACRCCRRARPGLLAGSDVLGRDMAVGLAYGARISLLVGITSTCARSGIGVLLGAVAGYYGGLVDDLLMRVTEFFQIIPSFVLADGAGGVPAAQPCLHRDRHRPDHLAASGAGGARRIPVACAARIRRGGAGAGHGRRPHHLHPDPAQCPAADRGGQLHDGGQRHPDRIGVELSGAGRSQPAELGQHDRRLALGHVGGLVDHGAARPLHHGHGAGAELHRRRAERRPQSRGGGADGRWSDHGISPSRCRRARTGRWRSKMSAWRSAPTRSSASWANPAPASR